jgi:hypothetical protein
MTDLEYVEFLERTLLSIFCHSSMIDKILLLPLEPASDEEQIGTTAALVRELIHCHQAERIQQGKTPIAIRDLWLYNGNEVRTHENNQLVGWIDDDGDFVRCYQTPILAETDAALRGAVAELLEAAGKATASPTKVRADGESPATLPDFKDVRVTFHKSDAVTCQLAAGLVTFRETDHGWHVDFKRSVCDERTLKSLKNDGRYAHVVIDALSLPRSRRVRLNQAAVTLGSTLVSSEDCDLVSIDELSLVCRSITDTPDTAAT